MVSSPSSLIESKLSVVIFSSGDAPFWGGFVLFSPLFYLNLIQSDNQDKSI